MKETGIATLTYIVLFQVQALGCSWTLAADAIVILMKSLNTPSFSNYDFVNLNLHVCV